MKKDAAIAALAEHRRRIDELDRKLLSILNDRTREVERIGAIKRQFALPVYEPKREEAVFQNVLAHNSGPLSADALRRIFERIIDEMRSLQKTGSEK